MARKFYAVRVGRTPGVYETWDECRRQITGFAGALYKGFASKEEALAFAPIFYQRPHRRCFWRASPKKRTRSQRACK